MNKTTKKAVRIDLEVAAPPAQLPKLGRPRKHASQAARQRACRTRAKRKITRNQQLANLALTIATRIQTAAKFGDAYWQHIAAPDVLKTLDNLHAQLVEDVAAAVQQSSDRDAPTAPPSEIVPEIVEISGDWESGDCWPPEYDQEPDVSEAYARLGAY